MTSLPELEQPGEPVKTTAFERLRRGKSVTALLTAVSVLLPSAPALSAPGASTPPAGPGAPDETDPTDGGPNESADEVEGSAGDGGTQTTPGWEEPVLDGPVDDNGRRMPPGSVPEGEPAPASPPAAPAPAPAPAPPPPPAPPGGDAAPSAPPAVPDPAGAPGTPAAPAPAAPAPAAPAPPPAPAPAPPAVPQVAPAPTSPAPVSSPRAREAPSREGFRAQGRATEKPPGGNDALATPAPAVAPAPPEATIAIEPQGPSAVPAPVAATPAAAAAGAPSGDRYEVRPGDTLWSIAARLAGKGAAAAEVAGIVDELWRLNAGRIGTGNPDLIMSGTVLALPKHA